MSHRDPAALLEDLGVVLDPQWLQVALTHRSYAYEHGGLPHNERLEFLGDSVLGLVVTDALFTQHPDRSEGDLAKMRAVVVNATALAAVSRSIDLGSYLRLGRGEEQTGGREKSSILSDAMEAVIGAVYVDLGLEAATRLVHQFFDPLIARAATLRAGLDWKTSLQEIAAARGLGVPEYLLTETGPDHAKEFTARVRVGEEIYGEGIGRSKKEAEQQVAEAAYTALSEA